MIISEIDVEKYVAKHQKAQQRSAKLSGGVTGSGGQIGEVIKMAEKHYAFWQHAISKNQEFAKQDPQGLLNAWIEKFYGTSSVKINVKKAMDNAAINMKQGKKGADAIFRIVTAILLKPKSEQEAKFFREQILPKMSAKMQKEISETMPKPAVDVNPTAAQNQIGDKKAGSDGNEYEWLGSQWKNIKTGRMATKQIAAELGK